MQEQRWQDRQISCGNLVRLSFIGLAVLLLIGAGSIWILNIEGIIPGSLSTPLAAIFGVLGVLFTFLQWAIPFSPMKLSSTPSLDPIADRKPLIESPAPRISSSSYYIYTSIREAEAKFRSQVEQTMQKDTGALLVYAQDKHNGRPIHLISKKIWDSQDYYSAILKFEEKKIAYVTRHSVILQRDLGYNSIAQAIYLADFLVLAPDDYTVWASDIRKNRTVTVHSGQVTELELDWE